MRAVLIFCIIIVSAVACPIVKKHISHKHKYPAYCPSNWKIETFDSQLATLAFQGLWYVQITTPTYINGQDPLQTGLFFSTYPCTNNRLIFRDTTQEDVTDYNTEYEMTDLSYNLYTHTTETQTALLSPAYGSTSPYAIFNVGSQNYYKNPFKELHPFVDKDLIRHKIGQGICDIEYTIAVIGADDDWKEYMVLAVINQYDNFFGGNDNIVWVVTRDVNPSREIYEKAYEDIKRSGLSTNYLVCVDHSMETSPSLSVPTTPGGINDVIAQTSVSTTSATKSIVSDTSSFSSTSTSSSKTVSTTTTSTVIIEKSLDFSSPYEVIPSDLYKGVNVLKGLDALTIRKALSGKYYMNRATPFSLYDTLNSKVGLFLTSFPASSLELYIEGVPTNKWDYKTQYKVLDRGYNMINGEVQKTRGYISSAYSENHPNGGSVFSFYTEDYYDRKIEEINPLTIDGIIFKQPSDIYNNHFIISLIGYEEDNYIVFTIVNEFNNPFFTNKPVHQVYCYTRKQFPSEATINRMTQEILRAGLNPNYMTTINHANPIKDEFSFDNVDYESKDTSFSVTRGLSTGIELPPIVPKSWKIKTFKSQLATLAFQGTWNLQLTTPTYLRGIRPIKTGLFSNIYPCTNNQLIFRDTTLEDVADYNIEYEMTDSSYNLYTQTTETQTALLSPAYGSTSPYAIFNVGSQNYYNVPITDLYPFVDDNLIRHKIGQGICEIEYTIAVIGADDGWKEYMVLAVINRYDNFFGGNDNIVWVVTRDFNPSWDIYKKAYEDIKRSGLSTNYLVSVDHSLQLSPIPSLSVPTTPGGINDVVEQTSVSTTSATKSIVSDTSSVSSTSTSSSKTVSTTTTSTVIIEKSLDYSSPYEFIPSDLYKGVKVLKGLDALTIRKALSGKYYMNRATPFSLYDTLNSKVGLLLTSFPACSMELYIEGVPTDKWDYNTHYRVLDRGYNMINGEVQQTRGFISSAYSEDHPNGGSVFSFYTEEYYDKEIEEINPLDIDGMISKPPTDKIYKNHFILSIIGYVEDEFIVFTIANQFKNPFFSSENEYLTYAYTRERIASPNTLKAITQQILYSGIDPNHMVTIDHTKTIDTDYVFDGSSYESQTSSWSSSSSGDITSSTTITSSSSKSISISCD